MLKEKEIEALEIASLDPNEAPARACFEVVLFYDAPREQIGPGLLRVVEQFLARVQARHAELPLIWYRAQSMTRSRRLPGTAAETFESFAASADFKRPGDIDLLLHAGPDANLPQAPTVTFASTEEGAAKGKKKPLRQTFLRLCLPPAAVEEGRELFEFVASLIALQPVLCAHAGYSWYWDPGDAGMYRQMDKAYVQLLKHPAMGYHDPQSFQDVLSDRLIQVGWLTVLGAALLAEAEADKPLAFPPEEGVGVSRLKGGGVILVAGREPILGSRDPAEGAALRPYRAVGRRLAALRLSDDDIDFMGLVGFPGEEETRAWYLRFFGEETQ